jgi:hypothetical protein
MDSSFVGFRQPLFVNKETTIVRTTAPSSDDLPSTIFFRKKPQQASTKEQYNRAEDFNHKSAVSLSLGFVQGRRRSLHQHWWQSRLGMKRPETPAKKGTGR